MMELVAHPAVLPCLTEAFGAGVPFRLDHDYAFLLRAIAAGAAAAQRQRGGLHGGPGSATITCVWELEDVTAHDGGFAAFRQRDQIGRCWLTRVSECCDLQKRRSRVTLFAEAQFLAARTQSARRHVDRG